ncbi:hypothetical protein NKR19_g3208 [Coniochaeta hoffmannii]|uniref:Uncharacterized protein n=1 Tax=Coniochaeta hoffmannii TaxID=91930 RepID=A0AA38S993_9PEZI|nr:hypothetical protein NKR19_g3208 [Coniochaeta hoffmannii]
MEFPEVVVMEPDMSLDLNNVVDNIWFVLDIILHALLAVLYLFVAFVHLPEHTQTAIARKIPMATATAIAVVIANVIVLLSAGPFILAVSFVWYSCLATRWVACRIKALYGKRKAREEEEEHRHQLEQDDAAKSPQSEYTTDNHQYVDEYQPVATSSDDYDPCETKRRPPHEGFYKNYKKNGKAVTIQPSSLRQDGWHEVDYHTAYRCTQEFINMTRGGMADRLREQDAAVAYARQRNGNGIFGEALWAQAGDVTPLDLSAPYINGHSQDPIAPPQTYTIPPPSLSELPVAPIQQQFAPIRQQFAPIQPQVETLPVDMDIDPPEAIQPPVAPTQPQVETLPVDMDLDLPEPIQSFIPPLPPISAHLSAPINAPTVQPEATIAQTVQPATSPIKIVQPDEDTVMGFDSPAQPQAAVPYTSVTNLSTVQQPTVAVTAVQQLQLALAAPILAQQQDTVAAVLSHKRRIRQAVTSTGKLPKSDMTPGQKRQAARVMRPSRMNPAPTKTPPRTNFQQAALEAQVKKDAKLLGETTATIWEAQSPDSNPVGLQSWIRGCRERARVRNLLNEMAVVDQHKVAMLQAHVRGGMLRQGTEWLRNLQAVARGGQVRQRLREAEMEKDLMEAFGAGEMDSAMQVAQPDEPATTAPDKPATTQPDLGDPDDDLDDFEREFIERQYATGELTPPRVTRPSAPAPGPATSSMPATSQTHESPLAVAAWNASFRGTPTEVDVDGTGLLCGINALCQSLLRQRLGIPFRVMATVTPRNLLAVHHSPAVQAVNSQFGLTNASNFNVDQLGTILYHWGQKKKLNLRLGYRLRNGTRHLVPTPTDGEASVRTVWVQSTSASGVTADNSTDHYLGLQPGSADPDSYEGDEKLGDKQPAKTAPAMEVVKSGPNGTTFRRPDGKLSLKIRTGKTPSPRATTALSPDVTNKLRYPGLAPVSNRATYQPPPAKAVTSQPPAKKVLVLPTNEPIDTRVPLDGREILQPKSRARRSPVKVPDSTSTTAPAAPPAVVPAPSPIFNPVPNFAPESTYNPTPTFRSVPTSTPAPTTAPPDAAQQVPESAPVAPTTARLLRPSRRTGLRSGLRGGLSRRR